MKRKTIWHIIEWAVAIAAYAWLGYQLATYDRYDLVASSLRSMGWLQWTALVLCVALMPLNMAIEAWRWKTLMGERMSGLTDERSVAAPFNMSFAEAQRQVYYSKLAGLVTPWRLGEYPSRALLMSQKELKGEEGRELTGIWPRVLAMGAVGSTTMTAAIVLAGVAGIVFSPAVFAQLGSSYLYSVGVVVVVIAALYALMPRLLRKYAVVTPDLLVRSTAQSLVRLVCWCVQLALVLWAVNGLGEEGISGLVTNTFIYYLLVTITPNIPIVEAGVRGAWAMFLFGSVNAAIAGVVLWAINTLLPCLVWLFFRKKAE